MQDFTELTIKLDSHLGKQTEYAANYDPSQLFAIPRQIKRAEIGIHGKLPFYGLDIWNHYEVSWLNEKGKPEVAYAEIIYSCDSPNIIESKSLKLYFNSFNNSKFSDAATVQGLIAKDLSARIEAPVQVKIIPISQLGAEKVCLGFAQGFCLDSLDIECDKYLVDPNLLASSDEQVTETLYSNLLKSNCLVTRQPDWGSVQISYRGRKIDPASLLRYIVSFRNHNEFHEQCIERIFIDIMQHCQPQELSVYGRYTRRGGIDINPYRTTQQIKQPENLRLFRQ